MTKATLFLKRTALLLLPVLAAALAWAAIIDPVLTYHDDLRAELESKRDIVRRYAGLVAQRERLKSELARLRGEKNLQDYFYAVANPNAGAALLQQKLSAIITANGGQVRIVRIEAKSKSANLEPFAVTLTFAVSTVGLSKILFQVEAQKPLILVDTLLIRAAPTLARLRDAAVPGWTPVNAEDPVLEVSITASGFVLPKG